MSREARYHLSPDHVGYGGYPVPKKKAGLTLLGGLRHRLEYDFDPYNGRCKVSYGEKIK